MEEPTKPPAEAKPPVEPKSPPAESPPPEQAQPPAATPPAEAAKPSGKSNTGVIILIIVLALAVLGAGGYFTYRYFAKKAANKLNSLVSQGTTALTATASTTAGASGKTSVQTVINALMYPGSKITDQKQGEQDSAYKAELTLSSPDTVDVIKAYYQKLATGKKWQVTRQGSSGDNNYYMTVSDGVFTAEIDTTKYEGYDTTDIGIKISGENLSVGGITASPTTSSQITSTAGATSSSTSKSSSGNYIISDSSNRVISESELFDLTPWQLKVARNEIYARHGREFVHKDLQCYFASKTWYKVDPNFSESTLTSTETKNVATIQVYEQKTGSPLASKDSGCGTNS